MRESTRASMREAVREREQVFTIEHHVDVGEGLTVCVRESFTERCTKRLPRRAVLMIGGIPVTGELMNIPLDGYRGRERLAHAGFAAFSVDLLGTGKSSCPDDGFALTVEAHAKALGPVLDHIRRAHDVPRVDVLGEGEGGSVAIALAADDERVRSCVLGTMFYKNGTETFDATFNGPAFRAFILGAPSGYLELGREWYFNLTSASSRAVTDWIVDTQPGRYAIGVIAEAMRRQPPYTAERARVPALLVRGEHDQNAPRDDIEALAAAYGAETGIGPARLVEIPGGHLVPRLEPAPVHEAYWEAVLDFWKEDSTTR